jgi:predicted nucleic acid-binding protein
VSAYFDSAVLIKLYVPEPNSSDAAAWVSRYTGPIVFTHLQENEVRNAVRLKAARKEISDAQLRAALASVTADVEQGTLCRPALDWASAWQTAERLSHRYAHETLCRTLDTLHVAVAQVLKISDFVSLDERQRKLAAKAGLRVMPEGT